MEICPTCGRELEENTRIEREGFRIERPGKVTFEGHELLMRPSGVKLMWELASADGNYIKASELLGALGAGTTTNGLAVQIKNLRNALAKAGAPNIVHSSRHLGYRWGMPDDVSPPTTQSA